MCSCWAQDPDVRPSFSEVVDKVQSIFMKEAATTGYRDSRNFKREDLVNVNYTNGSSQYTTDIYN